MRLTHSLARLHLADDYGSRLDAVLRFIAIHPGRDRCEVWRWNDPAPFLLETSQRLGLAR
jgi:hypothetical protein